MRIAVAYMFFLLFLSVTCGILVGGYAPYAHQYSTDSDVYYLQCDVYTDQCFELTN